jgi:ribonuclease-3
VNYQRLEFLGDAILGQVISEYLYRRFPALDEGSLSRMRDSVISTPALAAAGRRLGLDGMVLAEESLFDDRGLIKSDSILEDVFEAVIAAVYLDSGYQAAKDWIFDSLRDDLEGLTREGVELDSKSRLQQCLLKRFQELPEYEMLEQTGPPHRREFLVRCLCHGVELGRGKGPSLQAAEQEAAARALDEIEDCYQRIEEVLKG